MRCTKFRNPFLRWFVGIGYAASFTAMAVKLFLWAMASKYSSSLSCLCVGCGLFPFVDLYRHFLGLPPKKRAAKKATRP